MGFLKLFSRFLSSQSKFYRAFERQKGNSGRVSVYVVGSGYKWNPKSVFVNVGHKRFLFNCGPGLSRLTVEHKRMSRYFEAVFITRPVWENIGGLPTFLLKLRDIGVQAITVHGFKHIANMCEAGKLFSKHRQMKIIAGDGQYAGNHVTLSNIKLAPKSTTNNESSDSSRGSPQNCCSQRKQQQDEEVTAYILVRKDTRKQLLYERLVEKGVPPGPMAVQLLQGESITLPDGNVIHPEDIVSIRGNDVVLVVDCPSEGYISALEEAEPIQQWKTCDKDDNIVIVHFTPAAVMKQSRYIQWMKGFPSSTIHLVVNDSNLADGLLTLRYRQQLLSTLHSGIFPPLKDAGFYWLPTDKFLQDSSNLIYGRTAPFFVDEKSNPVNIHKTEDVPIAENGSPEWLSQWQDLTDLNIYESRPGTRAILRPLAVQRTGEKYVDGFSYKYVFESTLPEDHLRGVHEDLRTAGVDMSKPSQVQADFEKIYPRVVFLGTSGKADSKERNVSGILLRINEETNMLLDCGDGVHGQIHRLYGEEAPQIFRSISAVYISHLHGDHFLGLIDIIREREKAFGNDQIPPLILLAPEDIDKWLGFIRRICYRFSVIAFVPLHTLVDNAEVRDKNYQEIKDFVFSRTGFSNVQAVPVPHTKGSYGVAIEHSDGWKISYSGDTAFSYRMSKIGYNSDLLIHEATYDDDNNHLADRNRHCTVSQAVEASRGMNAKFTILTHLSQRYFLIPHKNALNHDLSYAFDFMQVPLLNCNELPLLHGLLTNMNDMYSKKNQEAGENETDSDAFAI